MAAAVELLKDTGLELQGLEMVMIGHSEVVSKPAAKMLMAEGAKVRLGDHMTRSVAMQSRRADVVIIAAGIRGYLRPGTVKPGPVVIDTGINQITREDGSFAMGGDADSGAEMDVADSVGPVTAAFLMRNAIVAPRRQVAAGWVK